MSATTGPEEDAVTLLAHASAYGGVATHLNQFASVLKGMTTIRHVFLFTNSAIAVNRDGGFPTPTLVPTLNSLWATKRLLLKLIVPLNFIREIWMSARYCRAICGRHVVVTSHDPHAFWGLTLFAGRVEYFLFVLPDTQVGDMSGKPNKLKETIFRVWRASMHWIVSRRLKQGSIKLVAPTPYAAKMWAALLNIESPAIYVIPNPPFLARRCDGILKDMQADAAGVDKIVRLAGTGLRLVLSVGHLVDYKNPLKWLELVQFAHEQDDTLLFVWAGDGEMHDEVRRLAAGYDRIILTGRLNQSDLRKLYEVCWVFFHPAIKESQGIVVMDALTMGIPVILNESEALPGLIGDSGAGFVLDCSGSGAATRFMSIIEKLKDSELHQQATHEARSLAARQYSHDTWIAELHNLFHIPNLPRVVTEQ